MEAAVTGKKRRSPERREKFSGKNLKSTARKILRYRWLYVMLIPGLVYYFLFHYLTMGGVVIAFQKYSIFKGILDSQWVGFKNFSDFFTSPDAFKLIRNTFLLSFYSILFSFPAPIVLALAFNEIKNRRFGKISQTITLMPHFISMVICVGLMVNFISPTTGIVNRFIQSVFNMEPINFLADPKYFRSLYVMLHIFKETGWGAIIYIAALAGVNPELYESAVMDGANRFRQIWYISLPSIIPTIVVMLILKMGNILEIGPNTIILFYNPMIYETADVLSTFVYRRGLLNNDYSFATAVDLFNSVVALILVMLTNKISKKVSDSSLW